MAGQTAQPGRSVISKALSIMSTFEALPSPVTVQDLAEHSHVPLSTTHRIVGELVEWGALERDKNGGLHLGGRLTALATSRNTSMRQLVLPHLEELSALTGHTVSLGLREGDKVRISERCYGQIETPRLTRVGSRVDLHLTAMGKTLLAHAPQWVQQAYLTREFEASIYADSVDHSALRAELQQIHSAGFVHTQHRIPEEVEVLAAPIYYQQEIACAVDLMRPKALEPALIDFLPALQVTVNLIEAELDHFQFLPAWDSD